jgi:hypothetical protein
MEYCTIPTTAQETAHAVFMGTGKKVKIMLDLNPIVWFIVVRKEVT